jgi:protein-S-isoprenylcysteine O-methyltransferase Ste14
MRTILAGGMAGLLATMVNWFLDSVWSEILVSTGVGLATGLAALLIWGRRKT